MFQVDFFHSYCARHHTSSTMCILYCLVYTYNLYNGIRHSFDLGGGGISVYGIGTQHRKEFGQLMICSIYTDLEKKNSCRLDGLTTRHLYTGRLVFLFCEQREVWKVFGWQSLALSVLQHEGKKKFCVCVVCVCVVCVCVCVIVGN